MKLPGRGPCIPLRDTHQKPRSTSELVSRKMGIDTGIHYPIPLHLQEAYKGLGYGTGISRLLRQSPRESFRLPMFPTLDAEQQRRVLVEL